MKYFPLVVIVLCCAFLCQASAYTVVMKNGKSLQGTLVSETADVIVFKDNSGLQYSLKKANLDLQKMAEANAPKPESVPAPPPSDSSQVQAKKKARVYTQQDLDALRQKYTDLSTGQPIENLEDFEGGVLKEEAYLRYMKDGAERIDKVLTDMAVLRDTIATNWEVGDSTGKGSVDLINDYLSKPAATEMITGANQNLQSLRGLQATLSEHPPSFQEGYDLISSAISGTTEYIQTVRNFQNAENVNLYRSRAAELEGGIRANLSKIQVWKPPAPKKQTEPKAPDAQEETPQTEATEPAEQ